MVLAVTKTIINVSVTILLTNVKCKFVQ